MNKQTHEQQEISYDLKHITTELTKKFPSIQALYLFGSRAYRTKSPRSDVDILVCPDDHIRSAELRDFSEKQCPALDLFLVTQGKAQSCMNDSYIQGENLLALVDKLDAIEFWSKEKGFLEVDIDWEFSIPLGVEFEFTVLPNSDKFFFNWHPALNRYFRLVEELGFPVKPYLGGEIKEVTGFIVNLLRRILEPTQNLSTKGSGLTLSFKTEYDFQNLFYLVSKPWLPNLSKEPLAIKYDGQEKFADFGLFNNKILIEIKHIRDTNTKASVVKTLSGLSNFYKENGNVKSLIFAIFVDSGIDVDTSKWENDFSFKFDDCIVSTVVIKVGS